MSYLVLQSICQNFGLKKRCPANIGPFCRIEKINSRMKSIIPPQGLIAHPLRNIFERKFLKAADWIPCLDGILPNKYLNHLALFVNSIYILLSDSIDAQMLHETDIFITKFIHEFQVLYGLELCYMVHCLEHLHTSVKFWGPL